MSKHGVTTREQKVAKTIIDMLSDIRLDLDIIGLYLGKYARTVVFNRFEIVYEAAKEEQDKEYTYEEHWEFIRNINN